MGKHKRKRTGRKHSSKSKFVMEKIKDVKLLHYIVPMRNADGVCLIAETGYDNSLFTTKHCFFIEDTIGKKGHPVRTYSLDNKDFTESMLTKFQNVNIYIEFLDFTDTLRNNIKQYIEYFISMSKYPLNDNAQVNLLNEEECYELISKL